MKPSGIAKFGTAALLLATALTPLSAGTRPIGPEDVLRIRTASDPQVDPSGSWVAYSVSAPDAAADKNETHLWMTRWDGTATIQLTGRKGESEHTARFSPDGRWLAFISARGDSHDDDQLWIMNRNGGEGRMLGGIKGSVSDIAWSPDSKTLALVVTDPDPDEEANAAASATTQAPAGPGSAPGNPAPDDAAMAAPGAVQQVAPGAKGDDSAEGKKRPKPIVIDRFQFKQDIDGYLGKQRQRLWLYDLASEKSRRLTTGDFDESLPAWSPDGRRIAFSSHRNKDPDRDYDSNLFVATISATPAEPRALTTFEGEDNAPDWDSYPAWSPDGSRIAYLQGGPAKLFSYGVRTLATVPAAGGAPTILTAALDRNVSSPVWSRDGRTIRYTVEDDGMVYFDRISASGGQATHLTGGMRVAFAPARGPGDALAVLVSSPDRPTEVFALEANGALRQLSNQNEAWLREVAIAPVAATRFASADGTEVHGFLVTPPGRAAARRLPTVLYNHGGPQSQYDARFNLSWQIFAGHGMAVVATNPRGGTGRGEAYAKALLGDWGGPAVPDALAGVDDAVAKGIADPARLYVGGWSYGGMLTNYLIASDTRFRAAVSGASIANALAGYGTDQYIRDYEAELGSPWTDMDKWLKVSYPFFHNERIKTPTLFMVGEKDFNVPALNSEQMYQALRARDIPTRLVIYPGEFHGFKRPSFLVDRMNRWLAWYDAYGAK